MKNADFFPDLPETIVASALNSTSANSEGSGGLTKSVEHPGPGERDGVRYIFPMILPYCVSEANSHLDAAEAIVSIGLAIMLRDT